MEHRESNSSGIIPTEGLKWTLESFTSLIKIFITFINLHSYINENSFLSGKLLLRGRKKQIENWDANNDWKWLARSIYMVERESPPDNCPLTSPCVLPLICSSTAMGTHAKKVNKCKIKISKHSRNLLSQRRVHSSFKNLTYFANSKQVSIPLPWSI